MEFDLLTKQDLAIFKKELFAEMDKRYSAPLETEKAFLRTKEVKKLLGGISNGTLQNLRIKGILKPSKIGGVFYYKQPEVMTLLNAGVQFEQL